MNSPMMQIPLRVIDFLRYANRNHSEIEIVSRRVEGDIHRYTYGDAYRRAGQLARALGRLGVVELTRVATLAWNGYRHFEIYYAVAGVGAVCHTINPRLFPQQIEWICQQARDHVLFFDATFLPVIEVIAPRVTNIKHFVILADRNNFDVAQVTAAVPGLIFYEDLVATESSEEYDWPQVDENSLCGLCYTSGTTGQPKGVGYTHRSTVLHALASALPNAFDISRHETILPAVPMFHVNAWGFPYMGPMAGSKLVFPGPFLDGQSLHALCESEQVTLGAGVPTVWLAFAEYLRRGASLTSLKRIINGGSAPSEALIREFREVHGVDVVHAWGMTETSPVGTVNQANPITGDIDRSQQYRLQCRQGKEVFGIELRLESDAGQVVARDGEAAGRLMVRGSWVVNAYSGDQSGSRADGWFDTGDIAKIDREGYMTIVDRSKDAIKSGGEWISSIELENAAAGHPGIAEVAVVGLHHPKWGERPLMLCVVRPDGSVTGDELRRWLSERVPKWWLPESIRMVEQLPYGITGKLLKAKIREQYASFRYDESGQLIEQN